MKISQGGEKERKEPDFTIMIGGTRRITLPGGLIAAAGMEPDIDGLPEEERLNF